MPCHMFGVLSRARLLSTADEGIVQMAPNCEVALGYIRREPRVLTPWVDVICVNQEDTLESEGMLLLWVRIAAMPERCLPGWGKAKRWNGSTYIAQGLKRLAGESLPDSTFPENTSATILVSHGCRMPD